MLDLANKDVTIAIVGMFKEFSNSVYTSEV
jgi:hypothetical protein